LPTEKFPVELPVLRLGLLGFSPAQQAMLETALAVLRTRLRWRLSDLDEADAICVNGSRVAPLPDGSLQIANATPGQPPLRVDADHAERPMAFSLPLAEGVQAASSFDMASPASTRAMLDKFEGWLRPVAVQFCLASRIVQARTDLGGTVYHVTVGGRLVAVISRRSGVGVLPIADPFHLENAEWAKRPILADEIPGHFVQVGMSQVLWQYAMRTERDLLPTYFRSSPIHWCRPPQLPQRLFRDSHLMIGRELARAPMTFAELATRTGLPAAVLSRDLAGLRLVGAVTHDRKQAQRLRPRGAAWPGAAADAAGDMTAPAPLLEL
jgi:hypothetical protein